MYYQGEPGAFSDAAIRHYFTSAKPQGLEGFRDVVETLNRDPDAVALLPIENAYRGAVYDVWDLLVTSPHLTIWAEVVQSVSLALMACPGETLESINRVRSHPQALMQSRGFWEPLGMVAEPALDTAGSARELAQERWPGVAAIAGPRASELYDLPILASSIEDYADNRTRFWLLSQKPPREARIPSTGTWKATLAFDIPHRAGTLAEVLSAFSGMHLNLTKIESRPRPGAAFEFRFWVDVAMHEENVPRLSEVTQEMERLASWYRILGCYPVLST